MRLFALVMLNAFLLFGLSEISNKLSVIIRLLEAAQ